MYLIVKNITSGVGPSGAPGVDGDKIEFGANDPPNSGTSFGYAKYFLNTETKDFYYLPEGTSETIANWQVIGSFLGDQGDQGTPGAAGLDGIDGDQWTHEDLAGITPDDKTQPDTYDEYKLDSSNATIWYAEKNQTSWLSIGTFRGEKGDTGDSGEVGDQGSTGQSGQDGNLWTAYNGVPLASDGKNNDFHFNTENASIYKKSEIYSEAKWKSENPYALNDTVVLTLSKTDDTATEQDTYTITFIDNTGNNTSDTTFSNNTASLVRSGSAALDDQNIVSLLDSLASKPEDHNKWTSFTRVESGIEYNILSKFPHEAGSIYTAAITFNTSNSVEFNFTAGSISWVVLAEILDGSKGDAATLSVGTVTTGNEPSVTNVGTANDAILDIVLPEGTKGEVGDKGSVWTSGDYTPLDYQGQINDFHFNTDTLDILEKKSVDHLSTITVSGQMDGTADAEFDINGIFTFEKFSDLEKAEYRQAQIDMPDYIIVYDPTNTRWVLRLDDSSKSPPFAFNYSTADNFYPLPSTWEVNSINFPGSQATIGTITPSYVGSQKLHWFVLVNLLTSGERGKDGSSIYIYQDSINPYPWNEAYINFGGTITSFDRLFIGKDTFTLYRLLGGLDGSVTSNYTNFGSLKGEGIPKGGIAGQVLAKSSSQDYDTQWINPTEASGGGGGDATNLGVDLRDGDSLTITSSTGTHAEVESASSTLAGLLSSSDKNKIDNLSSIATTGSFSDLSNVPAEPIYFGVACSDEISDLTTGKKVEFTVPASMSVTKVKATLSTAPTGSALTVDIRNSGVSLLSESIVIEDGSKTSTSATTQPTIDNPSISEDDTITVHLQTVGSTITGAGLKVWLVGTEA
jgi:hypothetical protein